MRISLNKVPKVPKVPGVLVLVLLGCQMLVAGQLAQSEISDGQQAAANRVEGLVLSEVGAGQQSGSNQVEGWPQFRGPGSTGVGEGANLPDTWSATQNVTWKTEIRGQGWSSANGTSR